MHAWEHHGRLSISLWLSCGGGAGCEVAVSCCSLLLQRTEVTALGPVEA